MEAEVENAGQEGQLSPHCKAPEKRRDELQGLGRGPESEEEWGCANPDVFLGRGRKVREPLPGGVLYQRAQQCGDLMVVGSG